MFWHWQNLNEDREGNVKGSGFWHGRAWWHWPRFEIHAEWLFGKRVNNLSLLLQAGRGYDDKGGLSFHIALPWLASLWIGFEHRVFDHPQRTLHLTIYRENIHWSLWANRDETWGWRNRCMGWDRIFKGRSKSSSRVIEEKPVAVIMPERIYFGQGTLEEVTRTYSRWPWPRRFTVANIEIPDGIPTPGKGENSWDCGDDATYGIGGPAKSIDDLIPRLFESVMRDRERYGGRDWDPTKAETYKPA